MRYYRRCYVTRMSKRPTDLKHLAMHWRHEAAATRAEMHLEKHRTKAAYLKGYIDALEKCANEGHALAVESHDHSPAHHGPALAGAR